MQKDEYNWWNTPYDVVRIIEQEMSWFSLYSNAPIETNIRVSMDLKPMLVEAMNLYCTSDADKCVEPETVFMAGVEVFFVKDWPEHTIRVY